MIGWPDGERVGAGEMRISIGLKVFGIVAVLLALVGAVAWVNANQARQVEVLMENISKAYLPAYGALARGHIRSSEEGALLRRLLLDYLQDRDNRAELGRLRERVEDTDRATDMELATARRLIQEEIADEATFGDKVDLARLDTRVEFIQRFHVDYGAIRDELLAVVGKGEVDISAEMLHRLDRLRDRLNEENELVRREMLVLADKATALAIREQNQAVTYGVALLIAALLLGALVAAAMTVSMIRPIRRLLHGTAEVQRGMLDTDLPVTSSDEVGELTQGFNVMVRELRAKARIRETFGRYVDPRIVEGLIDRPDLLAGKGERRVMTVFFCDMKGFTSLSEGMTPSGMVNVVNRYLALMSDPVRRQGGIIDKYIGDAIMAFWGPPFSAPEDAARLACLAGLEQLATLERFRAELPELTGIKRGIPLIDMRIGIATGDAVVGNIGSDVTMSYTVMGDTVNFASRLEGASKAYGTRFLVSAQTAEMAGDSFLFREIDALLVVGKQDPQQVFEVLGRAGEVTPAVQDLRLRFAEGLAAYRRRDWDAATAAFEACLALVPGDGPSEVFLKRVAGLRASPPAADWNGVWTLLEK